MQKWFSTDPEFDTQLRSEFLPLVEDLLVHPPTTSSLSSPDEILAAILALDQLPRNLFRGQARAYAGDATALR